MKDIFVPRKGLAQNVAFLAVLAAVEAVLSLVLSFFPLASLFVTIFLPSVSALAAILAEKKYLPVYVVGSSLLAVAFGLHDLASSLFYVVPAILSGALLGFFLSSRFDFGLAIFLSSLLNMGCAYLSLPISKALPGLDFVEFALDLLGLSSMEGIKDLVPAFFFAYGTAGTALSSFFVIYLARRIGIEDGEERKWASFLVVALGLAFSIVSLSINTASLAWSFLLGAMALLLTLLSLSSVIKRNPWWLYALLVVLEFGALFLFAFLSSGTEGKDGFAFLPVFFLPVGLFALISLALPCLGQGPKMKGKA